MYAPVAVTLHFENCRDCEDAHGFLSAECEIRNETYKSDLFDYLLSGAEMYPFFLMHLPAFPV